MRNYWIMDEHNFYLKIVQLKEGNPLIGSIDKKLLGFKEIN